MKNSKRSSNYVNKVMINETWRFHKVFGPIVSYNVERRMNIRLVELSCGKWGHHLAATGRIVTKSKLFWLGFERRLRIVTRIRHEGARVVAKVWAWKEGSLCSEFFSLQSSKRRLCNAMRPGFVFILFTKVTLFTKVLVP